MRAASAYVVEVSALLMLALTESIPLTEIIDTHVHNSFVSKGLKYSFPSKFPDLNRDWNISEFYTAARLGRPGLHISAVLMELDKAEDVYHQSLEEARLFQRVSDECNLAYQGSCHISGIVASAPVSSGVAEMRGFLPKLMASAPQVRGIREAIWKKSVNYFVNETYWASLREVARLNLTLDLLLKSDQLLDVAKLADAIPELRINLDHLAYPNVSSPTFDKSWETGLREIAKRKNVYAKLSGLPQSFGRTGWSRSDFQAYIDVAVEVFGPQRLNFAGNWFVLNEFGNYSTMLSTIEECLSRVQKPRILSSDDVHMIFAGTARALYGLESQRGSPGSNAVSLV